MKRPRGGLVEERKLEHGKDGMVRQKGKETVAGEWCGQDGSGKPRSTWETGTGPV